MRSRNVVFITLALFLLAACGGQIEKQESVEPEINVETLAFEIYEKTAMMNTAVAIVNVTSTYEVSLIPTETSTPEPKPTEIYQIWTSAEVANYLIKAGLELENTRPIEKTKEDHGMSPMSEAEGTRFYLPSLCSDCGGRIFSFSSEEDLQIMKNYFEELGKQSGLFFSWVFTKDNILIQINGDLSEDRAEKYKEALESFPK